MRKNYPISIPVINSVLLRCYRNNSFNISWFVGKSISGVFIILVPYIIYNGIRNLEGSDIKINGLSYLDFAFMGSMSYLIMSSIILEVARYEILIMRTSSYSTFLYTMNNKFSFWLGIVLSAVIMSIAELSGLFIFGILTGVNFDLVFNFGTLIAISFLILLGVSIGHLASQIMLRLKDTYFVQNTILYVVMLLGGFFFPVENLPESLYLIIDVVPIYDIVELSRGTNSNLFYTVSKLLFFIFISSVLSHFLKFRRKGEYA